MCSTVTVATSVLAFATRTMALAPHRDGAPAGLPAVSRRGLRLPAGRRPGGARRSVHQMARRRGDDFCPATPHPQPGNAGADDENGRGLFLVQSLSERRRG